MSKEPCSPKVMDFEERATRELHQVLEAAGWDDWAQYRVQVLFNGADPVCPTAQQRARQRAVAEKLAREMGLPLAMLMAGEKPPVRDGEGDGGR